MNESDRHSFVVVEAVDRFHFVDEFLEVGEDSFRILVLEQSVLEARAHPVLSFSTEVETSNEASFLVTVNSFEGEVHEQLIDPIVELVPVSIEEVGFSCPRSAIVGRSGWCNTSIAMA